MIGGGRPRLDTRADNTAASANVSAISCLDLPETKHFPKDQYKKAAELGFAGIYVSEENGGCGLSRLESTLIFEGLATGKEIMIVLT